MRTKGSAQELEHRRRLAVLRVQQGWSQTDVAAFLGVDPRTVRTWMARHRADPEHGLDARPHPGRPPNLTPDQENLVLSWFSRRPTEFGFPTELWTAARVARLIEQQFGVRFHPRYLSAWLAQRRISPQKPQRQPRERDATKIARWLAEDWIEVKKKWPAVPAWS